MALDKELYRWAYEQYRQWNEAKLLERVRNAGQLTPQQAWQQYVALWEFGRKMNLKPSQWETGQKLAALEKYYTRLTKLEQWRREHGRES